MKRILLILSVLCLSLTSLYAKRGIPIQFGTQEKLEIVHEFPETEDYTLEGAHVDLASLHEEFSIMWILPLWVTSEPKLVLVKNKNTEEYWELDEKVMDNLLKEEELDKEELLTLGFYTRYGGKIILGLFIALGIWGLISDKKEEKEEAEISEA